MNAPNTRSILDYVGLKKNSELCRFVYFGSTRLAADEILKFFGKYARENFADGAVTGLMLVYPNFMIHLMESSEQEIFQACSCLINFEPKILGLCKYFPMETSVGADERFFEKWYGRKVIDDDDDDEKSGSGINNDGDDVVAEDFESFERVTNTYGSLMKSLYALYEELREAKTKSHVRYSYICGISRDTAYFQFVVFQLVLVAAVLSDGATGADRGNHYCWKLSSSQRENSQGSLGKLVGRKFRKNCRYLLEGNILERNGR